MSKITQGSTDREEAPKPRRKRRRRDLDRIHSKILQAKRKLDNVGKGGNNKAGQKKQSRTKICNRLLPEPAAGIYRNGAKGKNIQKAETLENTFHEARLKADALKLLKGDNDESKCIIEIPSHDKTTNQSPNKNCMINNLEWTLCLEQSPVLGKSQSQNQKPKKGEVNVFEKIDFNKIKKQNVNDESRHVQKEDMCKRRLFQNDREQLETIPIITPISTQIFDNIDLTKENKTNENETEQMCSKNSKNSACNPLNRYMEFCRITSAENFEVDILPNYHSDPVTTTIKKLRHAYTNSFRQQLLRKKNKQELENVESAYSVEHQACTSSDISHLSPIEFEVPKCSENHILAARLQQGVSQKDDKLHLIQNAQLKRSDGITRYSPTSPSSQNTFAIYNAVMENCKNSSDTQCSKQPKDIRQLPKSMSFYFVNEKDSIQLDSQKNPNHVFGHLSKSKRHAKDHFSIDIPGYGNSRRIDNSKYLETSIFLNDPTSEKHFSKDYSREKLPIAACDNCAPSNVLEKCNNETNKCNVKNVKRVPTILRRCSNIAINKRNHSVQMNGDYAEGLYKKCETNLFNRIPNNGIEKELYETAFPNIFKNHPTSSKMNAIFEQTNILEPQIELMKIKDSQESQVEQSDINMRPKEHNERNRFCRHDDSLYPRNFKAPYNTNAYTEKLPQQEPISPDIRKNFFHSNNYRSINHLQGARFSNSSVELPKRFPQQTKLHVCETNKQKLYRKNTRDQNQNIVFNNVNDRAMSMPILNFPQNTQTEKRSIESCQEMFGKTDVECAKNQINQNACHCNEQYIYFDTANCPRKYKEQAHYIHKETAQPESLCDTRGYNNSTDNCVSSTMQNVPLLSLKQKNNLYTYPKAIDDQHRAVLLQNVTQPVKYLAVKSGSDIQRIPVYINDRNVRIAENVPLKVIALMNPSTQTKVFPQEIATQIMPLQTDDLHFNDFATRKISNQSFVKRLDSDTVLFNPDSQSNIWYASNL